jgi:hypothetical protein
MQIKFDKVEENVLKKLDKLFGVENCLIEVNPGNVLLPPKYAEIGERILNLEVRSDDVWLISYPRTGKWIVFLYVRRTTVNRVDFYL